MYNWCMPGFKPVKGIETLCPLILFVTGNVISIPLPNPGSASIKYSALTMDVTAGETGYGTTTIFEKNTLFVRLHTPAASFVRIYRRCKPGESAAPLNGIVVV